MNTIKNENQALLAIEKHENGFFKTLVNLTFDLSHVKYAVCDDYQWELLIKLLRYGARIRIHESIYNYFLEVLPPKAFKQFLKLANDEIKYIDFGQSEGYEVINAFWSVHTDSGYNFYCQKSAHLNPAMDYAIYIQKKG